MNPRHEHAASFDPHERAAEKQASRDADAQLLASGQKSSAELRRENACFAIPGVRISLRGSRAPK
jgi:hypothetical protein